MCVFCLLEYSRNISVCANYTVVYSRYIQYKRKCAALQVQSESVYREINDLTEIVNHTVFLFSDTRCPFYCVLMICHSPTLSVPKNNLIGQRRDGSSFADLIIASRLDRARMRAAHFHSWTTSRRRVNRDKRDSRDLRAKRNRPRQTSSNISDFLMTL